MEKEKEKWTLYEELKEKEIELPSSGTPSCLYRRGCQKAKIDVASKTKNAREVRIYFVMLAFAQYPCH
jgi:hypothetical protein